MPASWKKNLSTLIVSVAMLLLCLPSFALQQKEADFIFVGPGDWQWNTFVTENGCKPRQWTAREKEIFVGVLNKVRAAHPNFFARAISACRPLGLVRRRITDQDTQGQSACMIAGASTIEVGDAFFSPAATPQYQLHAVAHELAHILDTAACLSTAPDFLKVAKPALQTVRKLRGPPPYAAEDIDPEDHGDAIVRRTGLPNLYSAENLQECFAECVSYYLLEGPNSVSTPFRKYVQQCVLKENPLIDRARKLYVDSEIATDKGEYDRAFRGLNELLAQYPHMLDVHCSRSRIWGFKRDFEMMEIEARQEMALLQVRHIPRYHSTYERVDVLLSDARHHRGYK